MSRQYVVIGLGRLGAAMTGTLTSLGHDVLGIDRDADLVQDLVDDLPGAHLVAADAGDADVLRDLNVSQFDGAAVVIGDNVEASILATANLKEMGVPMVVARATSGLHGRILKKVGADRVVQPEQALGAQLARTMASPGVLDYVDLGGDEALIESEVPEEWIGRSLAELELARREGLTVVALKPREGRGTIPRGSTVLREGDVIVVGGSKKNLDKSKLVSPQEGRG